MDRTRTSLLALLVACATADDGARPDGSALAAVSATCLTVEGGSVWSFALTARAPGLTDVSAEVVGTDGVAVGTYALFPEQAGRQWSAEWQEAGRACAGARTVTFHGWTDDAAVVLGTTAPQHALTEGVGRPAPR